MDAAGFFKDRRGTSWLFYLAATAVVLVILIIIYKKVFSFG